MATFSTNFMVNMNATTTQNNDNSSPTFNTRDSPFIEHLHDFEIKLDFNLNTNTEWIPHDTMKYINEYNNKSNQSSQIFSFQDRYCEDTHLRKNMNTINVNNHSLIGIQSDINNKSKDDEQMESIDMNINRRMMIIQTPLKLNSEYDDEDEDDDNNDLLDDHKQSMYNNIISEDMFMFDPEEVFESCSSSENHEESKNGLNTKLSINLTNNTRKHPNLWEIEDKYSILLDSFLRPFQIFLLIPPEIRNLVLLYFRDCTFIYMLNGGKNCGISCISTKHETNTNTNINHNFHNLTHNKMVNFKIYDIKSYNKQIKNAPILTTTFMNEWDLNTMKLCHGKDINISPSLIPERLIITLSFKIKVENLLIFYSKHKNYQFRILIMVYIISMIIIIALQVLL